MNTFKREGYTVADLIKALEKLPKDVKIVLSSDEEGNDFGLLGDVVNESNAVILWPMSGTVKIED